LADIRQIPSRFEARIALLAGLGQRQIPVAASKGPSKLVVDGGPTLKPVALLVPRHASPSLPGALGWRSSYRRRRIDRRRRNGLGGLGFFRLGGGALGDGQVAQFNAFIADVRVVVIGDNQVLHLSR
jgi:hypothetical protein